MVPERIPQKEVISQITYFQRQNDLTVKRQESQSLSSVDNPEKFLYKDNRNGPMIESVERQTLYT